MPTCGGATAGGGGNSAQTYASVNRELAYGTPESELKDFNMRIAPQSKIDYLIENNNLEALQDSLKYDVVNVNLELPELTGSEKQVKWAKDIRYRMIEDQVYSVREKLNRAAPGNEGKQKAIDNFKSHGVNVDTISDVVNYSITNAKDGAYDRLKKVTSASVIIDKWR